MFMPDLDCTASRRAGMTGRAPGFPPRAASISLAARDSGRLIGALGSRSSTHRRGSVLAGATLVSLAITLPIALTHPSPAAAGALVVGHERASVDDALRGPDLLVVRAADPSGDDARFAVDGRDDTAWTGRPGETRWT